MNVMSRLILRAAVVIMFLLLGMVGPLTWPYSGWCLAVIVCLVIGRTGYRHLTTLGSARWADADELRRAGMIDARSGLSVGRLLPVRGAAIPNAIAGLFQKGLSPAQSCQRFWSALRGRHGAQVRLSNAVHTAVFSPTGGGKGVSFVVPFLMECPDSCVVVDFKGENAKLTAEHRRRAFGHRTVLLDLYKLVTDTPDTFDPINFIKRDDPLAIDECNDLGKALVIRTGEEKEPHWNDVAELWIVALIAVVVFYGDLGEQTRSIQTIRDFLSHPQKLALALKLMEESDAWGGMLARMGGQLANFVDKEKSSTLTTVSRHLRFLDTLAVAESTKGSSFDPADLRKGKMTIYLILPPDHMRAQAALLRMWIGSFLRAVVRGGLQEQNKVHFILDEAASLGHLEAIDDAVDKYRGYGVRLQFYFQSLGQLKKSFPEGQEQTLLSNTTQVFFGVNDNATADYVSTRLGEKTVIVTSGGTNTGTSQQQTFGAQPGGSAGTSDGSSSNWQQQARRLMKPEEVMAMSPRHAITFTPGVPPIFTRLMRYYEEGMGAPVSRLRRMMAAAGNLLAAVIVLAVVIAITLAVIAAISRNAGPGQVQSVGGAADAR